SLFRKRGFPSLKVAPDSGSFGGGLQWQSNNVLERTVRGDRARGASIAWRLYARAARESASCGRSTRRSASLTRSRARCHSSKCETWLTRRGLGIADVVQYQKLMGFERRAGYIGRWPLSR